MTAPVVSETRKVMMATTAIKARPEIDWRGTSAPSKRGDGPLKSAVRNERHRGFPNGSQS